MKFNKKANFLICSFITCCVVIYYSTVPYIERRKIIKANTLKYILLWTSATNVPFVDMGIGQEGFLRRKCPHTNCFVTSNRSYLGDFRNFDVVAFSGPELSWHAYYNVKVPELRSPHQKYVFASIESPYHYPMCLEEYDNFFNWTWTYKLDSEVQWGFIVIRDLYNIVVGPKKNMKWFKPEEMMSVSQEFKNKLNTKNTAAAWFASNCESGNKRSLYVKQLQSELAQYINSENKNYSVDVYGSCGPLVCPRAKNVECNNMIKEKYYFYLSFENSLSPDYVTEKLLRALNNNAVPIVFGGANYSRFLPEGSYLDARELGVQNLADKIYELMNDHEKYAEYFKWTNYYRYTHTTNNVDTNEYCRFCELLNDEKMVKKHSIYRNFRSWWNTAANKDSYPHARPTGLHGLTMQENISLEAKVIKLATWVAIVTEIITVDKRNH